MSRPVVLCVDDEKLVLTAMTEQLRRATGGDLAVETAESAEEALEVFDELRAEGRDVPVVISDHIMPGMKGTDLLAQIHGRNARTLTVLVTGQADADAVGRAVNEAKLYRYLSKPWDQDDLVLTVREAVRRYFHERELEHLNTELKAALAEVNRYKNRLEAENVYLRDEIDRVHGFHEIVGNSPALCKVLADVERVAASDASVLILGESGTGKELIARAIHAASPRRERPLVKVNCAALPAALVESELFGHEKGAFSGALARRIGRFELADGGTLFLDEIGDMPLETQAKLLRVLQEGELERLGDSTTIRVDVRVIAATHRALRDAAATFREDLYYRLSVFPVHMPALRERGEDIELLAHHFTRKYAGKLGKPVRAIARKTLDALRAYRWPGNVRELQNVIERAVILARGETLEIDQFEESATASAARSEPTARRTLRELEIAAIRDALERCDWVVGGKTGAARILDIPATTLRERIQRYGIKR